VADCALLLQAIAGHDPRDPSTSQVTVPDYYANLSNSIEGLRIGIATGDWFHYESSEIASGIEESIRVLRTLKAVTSKIHIPDLPLINELHQIIVKCESATIYGKALRRSPEFVSERVRDILYEGFFIPACSYIEALSLRAKLLQSHLAHVFTNVDVVIAPIFSDAVPMVADVESQGDEFSKSARFTRFANYLGIPSLALPCGLTGNGLPMGFQLLAPCYCESVLLTVGHAYLEEVGWHRLVPPAATIS
jgi:aspartyl-tRNA(Asn)/glutamyl-tRNA(Gln) amidotransferase subunit A